MGGNVLAHDAEGRAAPESSTAWSRSDVWLLIGRVAFWSLVFAVGFVLNLRWFMRKTRAKYS